jgi:CubicO group peptidase (beta-lactamase class C family)
MGETADPVAHVHRFVERHLQTIQAPGVVVGLTSRDGPLGVVTDGHADLAAREPVRPEHLFQIGSISKSFTAIAVLQEHEAGRLDLHAPVTQYLPWFDVRSPSGPITPHHLLTHTSGLPTGRDFTGEAVHELWALRETEVGFAPGTRFHYSNAGYKALGLVLEAIAGKPWWRLVRTRVLDPLRMTSTDPITTPETRSRSATGHVPPFDDRPRHPSQGLVPAPWIESATADGTICSTAGDMCVYIRMLLAGGDPLLTERSFSLMTQRAAEDPDAPGELYGYGLMTTTVDGHRCIGHTGSTVGFSAWMEMHPADGVGVIVLTNADAIRGPTARFALQTLSTWSRGEPLPEIPDPEPLDRVDGAEEYAGTFRSEHGELTMIADAGRLVLANQGEPVALVRQKGDRFVVAHPNFELFPLSFERDGDDVTHVTHGDRWWGNDRYAGPATFRKPDGWEAVTGHWRSHNPWYSNFRILPRRGSLRFIWGWGEEDWELVPLPDGRFRVGAEGWSPRRIRFDTIIDGTATRAVLDGAPYYRTFTP